MKNLLRYSRPMLRAAALLMLALQCLVPGAANAQTGTTSLGTDFWVAFMPNYTTPANNIRIFIGSGTANTVHVDALGGTQTPAWSQSKKLAANEVWTLYPPAALVETRTNEEPAFKAIHIYSQNPIVVYGISNSAATTDSYLGLPVPALGTEYYVSCFADDNYLGDPTPLAGEFVCVAAYDNTNVTIHKVRADTRKDASGTKSHSINDTWTVSLMKGQTYMVQSTGKTYGDQDITGTYVTADKPFGLLSGHQRCSIPISAPNDSKDHIIEMLPPLDKWGSEYYDMPMAKRTLCGDYIRLIAGEDNVVIYENSKRIAQLTNAGDFVDRELVLDPVVYKEETGKKFLTVQHSYTDFFNGDQGQGDPFSIVMTPHEQFQTRLIFRTPSNNSGGGTYIHYATFICSKDSLNKILINGKSINTYTNMGQADIPGTSNPVMAARRIQMPNANTTYIATCGEPFGCYMYGFTDVESYGHPAGMALRVLTPDPIAPAELRDSVCGDFNVTYMEVRHKKPDGPFDFEDTRINEINLIDDPADIRWPTPSFNYTIEFDPLHPFVPGDSVVKFKLKVFDKTQDAYAAVWTVDRAGNDTVYEYHYYAPKVTFSPVAPYKIQPVVVTMDSCITITMKNDQPTGQLVVNDALIEGFAQGGKFVVSPKVVGKILQPGDTVQFHICYTPSDTVTAYDTLRINTGCVPYRLALQGIGVTPLILASDVDFGNVTVGVEKCLPVKVKNVGTADLIIDKNWLLHNTTEFRFSDQNLLPITLKPGQSTDLIFCFTPSAIGLFETRQDWGSNLLAPFLHQQKDTSRLVGHGIKPGMNWDRPEQGFWTECDKIQRDTVYLMNPSTTADMLVTKVQIEGTDADEFSPLGDNQLHYNPLENTPAWGLTKNNSIWVEVIFTPNLNKYYRVRHAKLVAYGKDDAGNQYQPEMDLTGYVRHSIIRLTPSIVEFGAVAPGTNVTGPIWIHNDGDTTLTLDQLTLGGGYTFTGAGKDTQIPAHDSIQVTVSGTVNAGELAGDFTVSRTNVCDTLATVPVHAVGTDLAVLSTGNNYQNVFTCQNKTATVSTKNTGSKGAFLDRVDILDPKGEYKFSDGTTSKVLGIPMQPNDQQTFTVIYTPAAKGANTASIVYTWRDTSKTPNVTFTDTKLLEGVGLHYQNTLSLKKEYADQVYTAPTGDELTIPVQMKTDLDPNGQVYGATFSVRYKRDEFRFESVTPDNAFGTPQVTGPTVDPTDQTFEIINVTLMTKGTPMTQIDSIAYIKLRYLLAKDTLTDFTINNLSFLDATGAQVCWVTPANIPGTFYGQNLCGDVTLRQFLNGNNPAVSISHVTPNPVNTTAKIDYTVRLSGTPVTIEVFNMLGSKSLTIADKEVRVAGNYSATFDASSLPSGTYTVRLSTPHGVQSKQIVVSK